MLLFHVESSWYTKIQHIKDLHGDVKKISWFEILTTITYTVQPVSNELWINWNYFYNIFFGILTLGKPV